MSSYLINWLIGSGSALAIVVAFLLVFYMNPGKFEHWMTIVDQIVYRLSSRVRSVRSWADRRAVASSIQDSVNAVCGQINAESPDAIPHPLKIEWVKEETIESFLKRGQAVIRLKHYTNQDRNIVDSTLAYLRVGLLPRAKSYLDVTLRKSCELKIATKVFVTRRDTAAFDYFTENELNPSLVTDSALQQDIQMLEDLDYIGFFTHVFLTEVKLTGDRLLGTMPTLVIQQELRTFASFLKVIANKGATEDVPLDFRGVKIKVQIVLVAKRETIRAHGVAAYVNRISRGVREGYESLYIAGWGGEFANRLLDIKSKVDGKSVTVLRRYDYPVKGRTNGRLLVCQSNSGYLAKRRKLQEEVKQAIYEIVPEVKDGTIEIVSLARRQGIGFKVAVRPVVPMGISDIVDVCMGKDHMRFTELKSRFSGEFCAVVPWSDNSSELILRALRPLRERYVDSIRLDEENLVADVEVTTDEAYVKAVGKYNNNVKLASELTGWFINIKRGARLMKTVTPEEELREILATRVPMIEENKIEIVRLARIEGEGSRVIVRWKSEGHKMLATKACRGPNFELLNLIRNDLIEEWLYFHEWYDDPKELIIDCLYPLRGADVRNVLLDDANKTATVLLHKVGKSPSVWDSPYNLSLAEKVSGWTIKIDTGN